MRKYWGVSISAYILLVLSMMTCFPGLAAAGGTGDVVTQVANANYSSPEFDFGTDPVTGLGIKMHAGYGGYKNGYGGVTVLGPTDAAGMQTMLDYIDGQTNHTIIQSKRMKGCEVREYTMSDGVGVGVILPDYFITVEFYQTGNSNTADITTALSIAQQTLDGLERAGLLSQKAPDIEANEPEAVEEPAQESSPGAIVTGNPLNEPIEISDTMNIAGVYNQPTAPTTFSINTLHLVTEIMNYHWNDARGATPGTIGLVDQNGKMYGPWQAVGTPGQGGVPDANWHVYPNIVIPAGTYTIVDSDPLTWARNEGSGGRGMGYVNATPHFEVTGGSLEDFTGSKSTSAAGGYTEIPAGVGAAGNIPGPSNTTEAIVGVAVPGLIATTLGALAGLGGGGGFMPPSTGTPLYPGGGGNLPGAGGLPGGSEGASGMVRTTNQLGRRRRDDTYVPANTAGNSLNPEFNTPPDNMPNEALISSQDIPAMSPVGNISGDELTMRVSAETGVVVPPESSLVTEGSSGAGIIIDTGAMHQKAVSIGSQDYAAQGPVSSSGAGLSGAATGEAGLIKPEAGRGTESSEGGIQIDVSELEASVANPTAGPGDSPGPDAEAAVPGEESTFNQDGFNAQGFDKDGFDREGFNQEGFDRAGFDREGYNKAGFDAKGFDREGYDKTGYNQDGFNKEGFNQAGFNREGFNQKGFDKAGFDREGYNQAGFDAKGFDREGYDKAGFNQDGFNKEGYNQAGFDREGFNQEGFDKAGFDREGYNQAGFDAKGFDREGYDKAGYNADGFDQDGFNKDGYDQEGYGRNGFDGEGFDREGYDVNGYNRKGYDRQGFDAKGYDKQGFDKAGFNKDGFDRDGYDKQGFNRHGWDREGFDKNGYDAEGYDRDGFNREGQSREGTDADGYDKSGFNEHGYDKDGFDREGFNYEGYNRSGYDPWGYDKQGYGKDGYHWSGYNAEGYDRNGRHWLEGEAGSSLGKGGSSPFDVDTSGNGVYTVGDTNPFTEREIILGPGRHVDYEPSMSVDDSVLEKRPPLGQPYPQTVEKYGGKPWDDEIPAPQPEKPAIPKTEDTGIIGPEDPMNTIKNHGIDQDAPQVGQEEVSIPAVETGRPEGSAVEAEGLPPAQETPSPDYGTPGIPQDGEKRILVGKTDGRSIEIEYDEKTGEWINTESGNIVNPDRFEEWQNDLAEDRRRAAEDLEKMGRREDAHSQAVDQNLATWKNLEQMQKAADKYNIGTPGGAGDIDKAIQDLKDDMLAGKEVDKDRMEQLKKIIGNRIEGKTAGDSGLRKEEGWIDTLGHGLEANLATAKEVVTGEKADGSISWKGMAARVMITASTGGAAGTVIDGGLTVAEAIYRIKDSVDKGESNFRAVSQAIGMTVLGEQAGWVIGKGGSALNKEMLERFPAFTNKAADLIETGLLKGSAQNQIWSQKLGLVSKQSAEETLDQINKRLVDIGSDEAAQGIAKNARVGHGLSVASSFDDVTKAGKIVSSSSDDIAKGAGKAASGTDDIAKGTGKAAVGADDMAPKRPVRTADEVMADSRAVSQAEKQVQENIKDLDKLPASKQQELVREQAIYDEYKLQAQERTGAIADKVQRGEPLTVEDIMDMKADPASMRNLKNIQDVDGVGNRFTPQEAQNIQREFNKTMNEQIHQPSYKTVEDHLHKKYPGTDPNGIRCRSVRTPGSENVDININTDNDVIAERLVKGPNGPEWVEIPKAEWEDAYYKSFAENSGFSMDEAGKRFPDTDWAKMDDAAKYRQWAKHHEEAAMDQFDLAAGRDFSNQRTWHIDEGGQAGRPMIEATPEEIARGVETVNINGKQMRPSSGYELVQKGQGKLLDAEQLSLMEAHKIDEYWRTGNNPAEVMRNQTEAMEQLRKTADLAQTVEKSYHNMGYGVEKMPANMQEAIKVINNNNLSPASRAARLQELGYETPGDFLNKVSSRIGSIRGATKK